MKAPKKLVFMIIAACAALVSCGDARKTEPDVAFGDGSPAATDYDLAEIEESGEIIVATMYGRDTYYNYHGRTTGLAYDLISNYAAAQGLRVRVETVKDTAALISMLASGEADVITLELPADTISRHNLVPCGAYSETTPDGGAGKSRKSWAVRDNQTYLADALNAWFRPALKSELLSGEQKHTGGAAVRRKVRAPYLSRKKGVISQYDAYFINGSRRMGWDWRLIAAQCYQESGFDPRAVSWAGAKGLMQIIPSTAKLLGVADLFDPAENIDAGCRYLNRLQGKFSDVRNRRDRICFTLAAYNGGYHHIRDAMSLARKNGKDDKQWSEVRFYVRNLDKPQYYNDPVVKNGYMIGSETYNYVESVMQRWEKYRDGKPVSMATDAMPIAPVRSQKKNRFTRQQEIISLKDSL